MSDYDLHKKRRKFLVYVLLILVMVSVLFFSFCYYLKERDFGQPVTFAQLEELPLDHIEKIIIVAHPDDETYWGGGHLAQEPYLVLCLTNGNHPVRRNEFEQALSLAGSVPLILNYPDKEWGLRSWWVGYLDDIAADISTVLGYKQWDMVVTHNPDGEYGHIQHIRTSSMVTERAADYPQEELFYFGKYNTKQELAVREDEGKLPGQLPEELYRMKQQMLSFYPSQRKAEDEFRHMFPYEEWYAAEK